MSEHQSCQKCQSKWGTEISLVTTVYAGCGLLVVPHFSTKPKAIWYFALDTNERQPRVQNLDYISRPSCSLCSIELTFTSVASFQSPLLSGQIKSLDKHNVLPAHTQVVDKICSAFSHLVGPKLTNQTDADHSTVLQLHTETAMRQPIKKLVRQVFFLFPFTYNGMICNWLVDRHTYPNTKMASE